MTDNVIQIGAKRPPTNPVFQGQPSRVRPERLRSARIAAGFSQAELAEKISVSRQTISAYEKGERHPEPECFGRLMAALHQPLEFYLRDRPALKGPLSSATYRSRKSATAALNARCDVWREWFAEVLSATSNLVDLPAVQLPEVSPRQGLFYSKEEIEEAATLCRRAWGLGDGPISNVVALLEAKGIAVARAKLGSELVDAFSYWCGDRPLIVLSSDKSCCVRSRFDAAHELGHIVLHRHFVNQPPGIDDGTHACIEFEANRFASAFLMPADTYLDEVFTLRISGFVYLKERWKVAIAAQVYRCLDLGILTADQGLNLRKQISKRRWRTEEPYDREWPVEQPVMLRKAFDLIDRSGSINLNRLMRAISLHPRLLAQFFNVNERDVQFSQIEPGPNVKVLGG